MKKLEMRVIRIHGSYGAYIAEDSEEERSPRSYSNLLNEGLVFKRGAEIQRIGDLVHVPSHIKATS